MRYRQFPADPARSETLAPAEMIGVSWFSEAASRTRGSFRPLTDAIGNTRLQSKRPAPTRTAPTALPYVPG
jgi:hypothetical protein